MGTFTAQHPDLLEQQEKKLFFKNLDPLSLMYTQLFRTKPSTKAYEDGLRVSTLGSFATKPEGTPVGFDDPVSGSRVRTVHTTYALGFRITMEMQEDELFGIMDQMPADLGDSARDHQERLAWGLINDGFNGTTYTGLEAGATVESLFNTGHAHLKTTTTQSNMLSPPVALSVTGLESLMTTARGTQSDADRQLNIKPTKLLYHQNLAHQAFVLLDTKQRPGTSDHDSSTVVSSRSGITPVVDGGVPYLTSTTAWYLFDGAKHDLTWNNRKEVTFDRAKDSDTFDQKFFSHYRASVMFREWRGSWGSNS